jgi:hypothetical protein
LGKSDESWLVARFDESIRPYLTNDTIGKLTENNTRQESVVAIDYTYKDSIECSESDQDPSRKSLGNYPKNEKSGSSLPLDDQNGFFRKNSGLGIGIPDPTLANPNPADLCDDPNRKLGVSKVVFEKKNNFYLGNHNFCSQTNISSQANNLKINLGDVWDGYCQISSGEVGRAMKKVKILFNDDF